MGQSPIKGLEVLLLADLKEDLHGVAVVLHLGEAAEVLLHLVPLAALHEVLEVLHVEVEARLLLQPAEATAKGIRNPSSPSKARPPKKTIHGHGRHSLVDRLFELLLVEELQDEENQLPAKRRHGSPDPGRSLQLSKTGLNLGPSRQIPPKPPAKTRSKPPKKRQQQLSKQASGYTELKTLLGSPEPEPTNQANSRPEHGPRRAHPAGIPADSVGATADLKLPTPAARIRPPGVACRGSRLKRAAVG
jgi:hypothetical protein